MAGYLSGSTINVTYKSNPQRYNGGYVTEDFFKIIGVSPIIGRDFTAEDNKPGAEKVIILGNEIWKRDFNGDPNIVGQSVRVNGKAATIIGVMPPNFKFPNFGGTLDAALQSISADTRAASCVIGAKQRRPSVMGRLKPGVTLDQANAEFIRYGSPVGSGNIQKRTRISHRRRAAAAEFISLVFNFGRPSGRCWPRSFSFC